MKRVLLLKSGEANPQVRATHGDYDRWFLQTAARPGVSFEVRRLSQGEPLPDSPLDYDAIWMTGSPLSVTQPEPWMLAAAEFLRMAGRREVPVLGVCFGHQLLSLAHGGAVRKNPNGREIGTIHLQLTEAGAADFLFRGVPLQFSAQATHEDEVPSLPEGATLLATNAFCGIQAMAIGPRIRGVQFHPEFSTSVMKAVISARAEKLEAEGRAQGLAQGERVSSLLQGVGPTPFGPRILHNFLDTL